MTRRPYTTEEENKFRRLWGDGATLVEIAQALSRVGSSEASTRSAISEKAKKLGLRRRPGGRIATEADGLAREMARTCPRLIKVSMHDTGEDAAEVAPAPKAAPLPDHPFWTPSLDAKILRSQGRYREISALAVQLRKPHATILQRWHLLRAS